MAAFLAWVAAALWTGSAAFLLLHALRWQTALRALQQQDRARAQVDLATAASPFSPSNPHVPGTSAIPWRLEVLVAARDEGPHLNDLLAALQQQHLPHGASMRLWLVDDGSTDNSTRHLPQAAAAAGVSLHLLHQEAAGKLAALARGLEALAQSVPVESVEHAVLLCTDADCRPRPQWAARHLEAHQRGAELVCGHLQIEVEEPGGPRRSASALRCFESAVSSLQVALGCAVQRPPFARGANWSVRLSCVQRAGGLRGLEAMPSGDDVHWVRRLVLHQAKTSFLCRSEAWVDTVENAQGSAQRARRRYGKVRDLPLPERLRQSVLFSALTLQFFFLALGLVLPGALWRAPLLTLLLLAVMARVVLGRGLDLLGERELGRRALSMSLALVSHALWHSLRGGLGGYTWKIAEPARSAAERTP